MITSWRSLSTLLFLSLLVSIAGAQERIPAGAADANASPPPPGVDKFYYDLSQLKDPKDRATKSLAERYISLVKTQEWSDLSGNFKTVAYYVKHDPNLTTVTIEIVKGRGTDRKTEQKTVPVDKLSKSCQSRVRQIDAMQKKLKELAATKPGENGATPVPGEVPENPGAQPIPNEGRPQPGVGEAPPAAGPDPSASDPDPLGFAEIQDLGVPLSPGEVPPPPATPAVSPRN
jgi:hypothetical protein